MESQQLLVSLSEKIDSAHKRIAAALASAKQPAIMSSFGKDSLVVIDLLSRHGVRTVFFLPHIDDLHDVPNKQAIIRRYNLDVVCLPQGRAILAFAGRTAQLMAFPAIGPICIPVPIEMSQYSGSGDFACADEMLRAREGALAWQLWPDLLFWGHKVSDTGEREVEGCFRLYGVLSADSKKVFHERMVPREPQWKLGPLACCSPIVDWSAEDVWDYIEKFALPVSPEFYGHRSRKDRQIPACYRCHDPNESFSVYCPRLRQEIQNLSHFTQDGDLGVERLRRMGFFSNEEARELIDGK